MGIYLLILAAFCIYVFGVCWIEIYFQRLYIEMYKEDADWYKKKTKQLLTEWHPKHD